MSITLCMVLPGTFPTTASQENYSSPEGTLSYSPALQSFILKYAAIAATKTILPSDNMVQHLVRKHEQAFGMAPPLNTLDVMENTRSGYPSIPARQNDLL